MANDELVVTLPIAVLLLLPFIVLGLCLWHKSRKKKRARARPAREPDIPLHNLSSRGNGGVRRPA